MTKTTEQDVALRLVEIALAKGYTVRHDYGELDDVSVLKPGQDARQWQSLLGCTEEDWLHLYKRDAGYGARAGFIYLLWGNAEDGSELVCDHSANDETEGVVRDAYLSLGLNTDLYGEQE